MAPFSPPLHNYPGNCGVIECITCSKETLPLFNKQLDYAPHVVGEQEEEHIRTDFWGGGRGCLERIYCMRRTEKRWVVQCEKGGGESAYACKFPQHRHTDATFSRQVLNLLCKVNVLLPVERLVKERVMRVGDG